MPAVPAESRHAKRIARRNRALVLIGTGALVLVGGGDVARGLGVSGEASAYIHFILSGALLIAGLVQYTGTKRPASATPSQPVPDSKWQKL